MRRWLPTLLVLLFPAGLPGQSAPDRAALDRFRDSLATADLAALAQLQRTLTRSADPMAQLRLGLLALRRHQLGADLDASEARGLLRRVARRTSSWPYAWHALAEAERARSAWERADSLALGSRVGVGSLERALEAERRALESDPRYLPAAAGLAGLALGLRDTALLVPARDALRRSDSAFAHHGPGPSAVPAELLLALGRLERATDRLDSALSAFARARTAAPRPAARSMAELEEARTALARGAAGAERLYF
ncbi:MAG TPA: hypothetical protein VHR43_10105, partial [Gemmatimonadales bacterium]|nr:hypothetical protein [Gemmatimonadales bacterium]